MNYKKVSTYYRTAFMQQENINLKAGAYELFVPTFNRQVFFFRCGGALMKVSKQNSNINKTA
jgi:hypothetical protein